MDSLFYIVNVEAAIYHENRWLIATRSTKEKHAGGTLALIGGKVETTKIENDVLEKAVKREILQEVGIEVADEMHYIKSSFFITQDGKPVIDIVFLCKYKQGEPKVLCPDELSKVEWITLDGIISNPLIPSWTKESIEKADQARKGNL